jgi:hypothetical protein
MSYDLFIQSIHEKRIINLTFNSQEKGTITRKCVSFDYGPSKRYKDDQDRYHLYDLDSPEGKHNLSILPSQIVILELSDELFEPGDYVKWTPAWIVSRDWGVYS